MLCRFNFCLIYWENITKLKVFENSNKKIEDLHDNGMEKQNRLIVCINHLEDKRELHNNDMRNEIGCILGTRIRRLTEFITVVWEMGLVVSSTAVWYNDYKSSLFYNLYEHWIGCIWILCKRWQLSQKFCVSSVLEYRYRDLKLWKRNAVTKLPCPAHLTPP